jgi:hypothetical protein
MNYLLVKSNALRRLHTLTGTGAECQEELDALFPSVLDRAFKPLQDASQGEL